MDYTRTKVDPDDAYFHAQFRKTPSDFKGYNSDYTMIDGIKGRGQYVGTYMTWLQPNWLWWGEGEIKFFMDGDTDYPTICGTGTEDYFCGSYDFDTRKKNVAGVEETNYTEFSTPYTGLPQVIKGDGHYGISQRFGLYRWHITDPIRFEKNLKVGGRVLICVTYFSLTLLPNFF